LKRGTGWGREFKECRGKKEGKKEMIGRIALIYPYFLTT